MQYGEIVQVDTFDNGDHVYKVVKANPGSNDDDNGEEQSAGKKWWQNGDAAKAEAARQSWNQWMPQGSTDYTRVNAWQQIANTPDGSKVLKTKALGGNFPWQRDFLNKRLIRGGNTGTLNVMNLLATLAAGFNDDDDDDQNTSLKQNIIQFEDIEDIRQVSRLVDIMNDAIGTKGFEVFGYKENLIRTIEIDSNKLNKQQLAFYNLIKSMTEESSDPYIYKFTLKENDALQTGSLINVDDFKEQRINIGILENLTFGSRSIIENPLYVLYHIFSEQKFGQDYLRSKKIENRLIKYREYVGNSQLNSFREHIYNLAHEYALNQALELFGYRYYSAYSHSKKNNPQYGDLDEITYYDVLDKENRYIMTVRTIDGNGTSKTDEGRAMIFINNEGHYMTLGEKIEDPEWRKWKNEISEGETWGEYQKRVDFYFQIPEVFIKF